MKRSALFALLVASVSMARPASRAHAIDDHTQPVVEAIHRSGAIQRCWNAYLASNPNAPSVIVRVRVGIDAHGSLEHAVLLGAVPTALGQCVVRELGRVHYPVGAVTAETTYSFSSGESAPIPAGP